MELKTCQILLLEDATLTSSPTESSKQFDDKNEKKWLIIKFKKTRWLWAKRADIKYVIHIGDVEIMQVMKFNYLATEIRRRVEIAKDAFSQK